MKTIKKYLLVFLILFFITEAKSQTPIDCSNNFANYHTNNYTISGSSIHTWTPGNNPFNNTTGTVYIKGELLIPTGYSLYIVGMTIEFGYYGEITIEDDAYLSITASTIQGLTQCVTSWGGIQNYGDLKIQCDPNNYSLRSYLKDGRFGVFNYIDAKIDGFYSNFENNYYGILFNNNYSTGSHLEFCVFMATGLGLKYPYSGYEAFMHFNINKSGFIDIVRCEFYGSHYGIYIWESFEILMNTNIFTGLNTGIQSFESKYYAIGNVFANTPCGILDYNYTLSPLSNNEILYNQFVNVHTCVKLMGTDCSNVDINYFNLNSGSQDDNFYGIFAENSSNFGFLGNDFKSMKLAIFSTYDEGNSNSENGYIGPEPYNNFDNVFTNCWRGVDFRGYHDETQIKCNYFNNPTNSIYSTHWYIGGNNPFLSKQGTYDFQNPDHHDPAGNEFIRPRRLKDITSLAAFSYDAHTNHIPVCSGLVNVILTEPKQSTSCDEEREESGALNSLNSLSSSNTTAQQNKLINNVIKGYIKNKQDSLIIGFLANRTDNYSKELLVGAYISKQNYLSAEAKLTQLKSNVLASVTLDTNMINKINIYEMLINWGKSNKTPFDMNSSEENQLRQIALMSSKAGTYARSLLTLVFSDTFNLVFPDDTLSIISPRLKAVDIDFGLLGDAYPNPANEVVLIPFNVGDDFVNLKIDIVDITGRFIESHKLNAEEGKIRIKTEYFKSGVYFYRLCSDTRILEQKKFVISR